MSDTPTAAQVVHAFVTAINARNIDALVSLMTDDHTFVDSMGEAIHGKDAMRGAWIAYSVMVPDYRIVVEQTMVQDDVVALFGKAGGTFAPDGILEDVNTWENHAAWRAVVRDGKVSLWQVFTDNEPVRVIASRSGKTEKRNNPRSA